MLIDTRESAHAELSVLSASSYSSIKPQNKTRLSEQVSRNAKGEHYADLIFDCWHPLARKAVLASTKIVLKLVSKRRSSEMSLNPASFLDLGYDIQLIGDS